MSDLDTTDSAKAAADEAARDAAKVSRAQDQCFLIDGWRTLRARNENRSYSNLIPMAVNSGEIVSLMNAEPDASIFFKMTPAQLSLLVPTIRLFLVDYNVNKNNVHVESGMRELYFDDFIHESDIEDILKSASGRGSGVGIKGFSYTYDGGNFATIDKSIVADLKIMFTDINIFTRKQQSNGASFVDLVERVGKFIPSNNNRASRNLANASSFCRSPKTKAEKQRTSGATQILNPEFRRIKALVGWALPTKKGEEFLSNAFFDGASVKGINSLLKRMQLELFLDMTGHKLDFHNDGRIELSIQYRASVESEMLSPEADLFFKIKKQLRTNAENAQEETKRAETAADQDAAQETSEQARKHDRNREGGEGDTSLWNQMRAALGAKTEGQEYREDLEKILAEQKQAIRESMTAANNRLKYKIYQSFIGNLIGKRTVFYVDVPKKEYSKWLQGISPPVTSDTEYSKKRAAGSKRHFADSVMKKSKFEQGIGGEAALSNGYSTIMNGLTDAHAAKDTKAQEEEMKKMGAELHRVTTDGNAKYKKPANARRIHFMFLGDILDVAMGTFVKNLEDKRESKVRMIASTMSFVDPKTGETADVNLCDIPIALDEFIMWYKGNVIDKMRPSYKILNFLEDVLKTLVSQSLGYNCFTGMGQTYPELGVVPMQYALSSKGKEPIPKKDGRYPRISSSDLLRKTLQKHRRTGKPAESYINYVVLHASIRASAHMNPLNVDKDEADGIYHLGIGLDRGIVKDIKFKASKLAHADTARIIDQGMENIGQLFNKYDADVTIWGCPLFKNGQHIYIDPRTMGVDSQVARLLGLGGYYVITRVDGELSSDGYFMTLSSKFVNNGLCAGESPPLRQAQVSAEDQQHASNQPIGKAPGGDKKLLRNISDVPESLPKDTPA